MSTADVVTGNSVATSAVSLSGLRKVYGDVVAVAKVDLEVRTGEIQENLDFDILFSKMSIIPRE